MTIVEKTGINIENRKKINIKGYLDKMESFMLSIKEKLNEEEFEKFKRCDFSLKERLIKKFPFDKERSILRNIESISEL